MVAPLPGDSAILCLSFLPLWIKASPHEETQSSREVKTTRFAESKTTWFHWKLFQIKDLVEAKSCMPLSLS